MIISQEMVLLKIIILTTITIIGSSKIQFIKPVQSYPARDRIFHPRLISRLMASKTLEIGDKITMNSAEIEIMTTLTKKSLDEKLTALHKYKTKMQSLLCFNAFIVYYFIRNMDMADPSIVDFSSFSDHLTPPACHVKYKSVGLNELHDFLNRMMSVFYIGQSFVPDWLRTIFIDLKMYFSTSESNAYFAIKPEQIQDNIMKYIGQCQQLNYLPSTKKDHYKVSIPFDECEKTVRIADIAQPLYDLFDFDQIKQTEQLFTVENFKLSTFIRNHDWLYSYNTCSINWNPIKELEKNYFDYNFRNEFIQSASFLYQKTIVRIITINLLRFVCKHVASYIRSVEFYKTQADSQYSYAVLMSDLLKQKLVDFWLLLDEPLEMAVRFLFLYDGPLWELTQVIIDPIGLIDITELETLFDVLKNELYCELDMVKSYAENLMNDTVVISPKTDIKSPAVTQNTANMKNYILKATTFLVPLDFYFLQFYINSNNNIIPMY